LHGVLQIESSEEEEVIMAVSIRTLCPVRILQSLKVLAALGLAFGILNSCTTQDKTPDSHRDSPTQSTSQNADSEDSADQRTETETPKPFMPECLNITEGDTQIEFDADELLLTLNGKMKKLVLDDGIEVKCEKLRIVPNARTASVEIVFMTRPTGTQVQIADRKLGVASIKDAKWIVKPLILDRLFKDENGLGTEPRVTVKWSEEAGRPVLTRTDIDSGKSEVFKP
jgi:hypothetical protein